MRELFRRQPKFTSHPNGNNASAIPDDLWTKCRSCSELIYTREYEREFRVCPRCGHHARLTARQRIASLVDPDSFEECDTDLHAADPLEFVVEGDSYQDKAAAARRKTQGNEALVSGVARIGGQRLSLAVTEFGFLGASMGSVFGEKLVRAIERAIEHEMPLVTVSSSGGARMQESMFSLMQMAKTTAALARLDEAGIPHIALLVDPCYGGVTASYATVADIIMAEPGAMIGFAGPRVIEQITRQKLPEGFQTAEFLLEQGMLDLVVPRRDLPARIGALMSALHYHQHRDHPSTAPESAEGDPPPVPVGAGAADGV